MKKKNILIGVAVIVLSILIVVIFGTQDKKEGAPFGPEVVQEEEIALDVVSTSTPSTTVASATTTVISETLSENRPQIIQAQYATTPEVSAKPAQVAPAFENSVFLGESDTGNFIPVTQVTLTKPGYVVFYKTNNKGESSFMGHSDLLKVGTHRNLSVQVETVIAMRQAIVAVLYQDNGDGKFAIPKADTYLKNASGMIVSDIDVVGIEGGEDESKILKNQVQTFIENNTESL